LPAGAGAGRIPGMSAWPVYAYFLLVLLSRAAFRHVERTSFAAPGSPAGPGPGRLQGALLCLVPLSLMQLAPLIEYWLRLRAAHSTGGGGSEGFFALLSPWESLAGLAVFAAGTALAAAASRRLASAWREAPGRICTSGIYARLRHPMYAGYLLQGAGCALLLGGRWSFLALAVGTLLVAARCLVEDRELAGRFPESAEHRRRTWRMIPGLF
jgi:protein-S-isoprenylcysteine O-methyltransferase Ste14